MKKKDTGTHHSRNIPWSQLTLELIVVFLGVTAGFLLNNWREEKQERSLERKYLNRYLEDINANIKELENAVRRDSLWLAQAKPLILVLKKKAAFPRDTATPVSMILSIDRVDLHNGTYQDMINSGNLNLVRNFPLRKKMADYQSELDGARFKDDAFYRFFNDHIIPFLMEEYDLLNNQFIHPGTGRSPRFNNLFLGYYSMVDQQEGSYRHLLELSRQMKDLISP